MIITKCSRCKSTYLFCVECHKVFKAGEAFVCDNPECIEMNAPLECECGFVASNDLKGVLNYKMELIKFNIVVRNETE